MDIKHLILGILLDTVVAIFWLFPDMLFRGDLGRLALDYPLIMAAVSIPIIALSLVFFITAFRPQKRGDGHLSPCIVALLGAVFFTSPFFGVDLLENATMLNIAFVVGGLLLAVWGGIGMVRTGVSNAA